MPTVTRTANIRYLKSGPKGEDASAYTLRTSVTQIHRKAEGTPDVSSFTVTPYKVTGENSMEKWPSGITVQCIVRYRNTSTGTEMTNPVNLYKTSNTVTVGASHLGYTVNLILSDTGNTVATQTVSIVQDGQQGKDGKTGPVVRGPRVWDDLPEGTTFYAGGDAGIVDVVRHDGYFWMCSGVHYKGMYGSGYSDEPGNETIPEGGTLWRRFQSWDLVATHLLLTENAVIENGIIRNLKTDIEGKRVEITHDTNDVKIYSANDDGSDRVSTQMSGDRRAFSELFGGTGGDLAGIGSITQPICTVSFSMPGGSYYQKINVGSVTAGAGLVSGKIRARIDVSRNLSMSPGSSDPDGVQTMVRPPLVTVTVMVNGTAVTYLNASLETQDTIEVPFSAISNGSAVVVTAIVSATGYSGYTGVWNATPKVQAVNMRLDNTKHRTEVFENGLATGVSTSNYLVAMTHTDGKMAIKGVSGNAGFCCYDNQLYVKLNGTWYVCSAVSNNGTMVMKLTVNNEPNI